MRTIIAARTQDSGMLVAESSSESGNGEEYPLMDLAEGNIPTCRC